MDAKGKRACQVCGAALADDSDLCPVCALRGAVGNESAITESRVEPIHSAFQPRFEHYEVITRDDGTPLELGRGAMGVTYKAFDTVLRHPVALKVIDARIAARVEARERFLREARAAARLRHANVASVFYYATRKSDGQCFYAMELVEGETLQAHLRRAGPLPPAMALEVIAQVTKALVAAEAHGLVHRDLKPANLMLVQGRELTVKVIDFGLAKAVAASASDPNLTHGGFVGTPAFASPEQFAGNSVDIRSDLYSLGITLWQMVTGQTPFQGSPSEVMDQHQHAPLPLEQVKGVPQPVVALLEALLEKDSARRLQSPADLLNALSKVTDAVKARRTITHQSLREISDQRLGASGKAIEVLTNVREVIAARRVRLILWLALMLVIGGGAILAVNSFFGPKDPAPHASRSNSPAVTAPGKSIAVLPFESLSENKNDSYFADGVQGEILSNLAKVSQLKVISRTSVMTFRAGSNRDLRSIATALGVGHVLEGTVRRDGNRVRITTELIDAETDRTLWSDSYSRDLTDIFAIQDEIAQTVVAKLSARLSPEEMQDMQKRPTENLEAYDLYLRAKASITNSIFGPRFGLNRQGFLDSITLLERATRLDPTFALAYCQIAFADGGLYAEGYDVTPERLRHYDNAVREALRLNPNLPEAHLAAGYYFYDCCRDYEQARAHLAVAESLLPNSSETHILAGYIDRGQGRWADSTKAFERACNLDPENPLALTQLGYNYGSIRRYRDQERIYNRLIALQPDNPVLNLERAMISFNEKADLSQWRTALEALPSSLQNGPEMLVERICFFGLSREWVKARELVRISSSEELSWGSRIMVPRLCWGIPIAKYQGEHPETNAEFIESRDKLQQKVREYPKDPFLLCFLGLIDSYLGRNQEAISESKSAANMSQDPIDSPYLVSNLAVVYAITNEPDLAFQILDVSIKTPLGVSYGDLKLNPDFDPLRADPRFEKLLAELAPKD